MKAWLNKKAHVSWFIAWASLGFLLGLATCLLPNNARFADTNVLILSAALGTIAIIKRTRTLLVLALLAGLLLGLYKGLHVWSAADYHSFIGRSVYISGTVADDVTHKNSQAGIKLSGVQIDGQKMGGQVWAGALSEQVIKRDQEVTLYGKLKSGFGNFAASMSYSKLVAVKPEPRPNTARQIRDNFATGLRKAVPEPQASLGLGYLTGQHNDLPTDLIKQLQLVGLIHIVIAGGYNVTILVRFVRRSFAKKSRYLATLAASAVLLGFTLMTGFVAPMARTAIVTGLSLAAWYYGRKIHPIVLILFAAAITAFANPSFVWGDVGWYLTFIAYGGLIILGPMLKKFFWGKNSSGLVKQILVDTVSVQIVTMPILALAFHQYSIYGLPANLLVLPLMPITMVFIVVAGLAGIILPVSAAHQFGIPADWLLRYTEKITTWLAGQPAAGLSANFNYPGLVATYGLALVLGYILWCKTRYNFRTENIVE